MAIIKLSEDITRIGWIMKLLEDKFGPLELVKDEHLTHITKHIYVYRVYGGGVPEDDILINPSITQDENYKNIVKWQISESV